MTLRKVGSFLEGDADAYRDELQLTAVLRNAFEEEGRSLSQETCYGYSRSQQRRLVIRGSGGISHHFGITISITFSPTVCQVSGPIKECKG
jgi:hypothetical protein